jgi:hypothetical protein
LYSGLKIIFVKKGVLAKAFASISKPASTVIATIPVLAKALASIPL